jgi:putative transposase
VDEVFVRINGSISSLWRAVEHEGEALESFVASARDRNATSMLLRKVMKRYGPPPVIVTDRLRSYRAAMREIGNDAAGHRRLALWLCSEGVERVEQPEA